MEYLQQAGPRQFWSEFLSTLGTNSTKMVTLGDNSDAIDDNYDKDDDDDNDNNNDDEKGSLTEW